MISEQVAKMLILVVDDDIRIQRMMRGILEMEGYRVYLASSAEEALDAFTERMPDLILMDIMLPGMDGQNLCRHIRVFSGVPIIMVTARESDEAKVDGLDAGADDYLTKPFSAKELAAWVRAVLRRSRDDDKPAAILKKTVWSSTFTAQRVYLNGVEINLTATEYRLLACLARNAGRVVTSDGILRHVWGENYLGENHLLQVNINRLRRKMAEDAQNPEYIITRHGIGYLMAR
ncbi:response regulator transcription factor [Chloroflexota bacterium]